MTSTPLTRQGSAWWKRLLSIFGLTILGLLLIVPAVLMTIVSYLTPERLTPIVEKVATSQLQNARVEIDTVELSLKPSLPFLQLDIAKFRIISTTFEKLSADKRSEVPQWADTVMSFDHFKGGINLAKLALGKLYLSDVELTGPSVNMVVLNDSITNFDIVAPSTEPETSEPFDWNSLPEIDIQRIAVTQPKAIRYLDVAAGTNLSAMFEETWLEGHERPSYSMSIGGNVEMPELLNYLTTSQITFGLGGNIHWDQTRPTQVQVSEMGFNLSLIGGKFDGDIDLAQDPVLNTFNVDFEAVKITDALGLLPDSLLTSCGIGSGIDTDATIKVDARLQSPYNMATDLVPHALVNIRVPDSHFRWEQVNFENIAADVAVLLAGDDYNKATVTVNGIKVKGKAIDLMMKATVTNMLIDPAFDASITGSCNLKQLPPVLLDNIPGSIRGLLTANADISGRLSMLDMENFQRLQVRGDLQLADLHWQDADTLSMAYANRVKLDFGSKHKVQTPDGKTTDDLLTATLTVDTASMFQEDLSMEMRNFRIGLGTSTKKSTTKQPEHGPKEIVPIGGGLKLESLKLMTLTDTAIVRLRDVDGRASIRPNNGDLRSPRLSFDLGVNRFMLGSKSTRMMLRGMKTSFSAQLQPPSERTKRIRHLVDSVRRAHPELDRDSLYTLALAANKGKNSRGKQHMHEQTPDSTEVIAWSTSNGFKRLLNDWQLEGKLQAERARMFTHYFPLRHRLKDLNMSFNNDSLILSDLLYEVGQSDFTLSGEVTNIRRALSSRDYRQALKINFAMESDTININELIDALYKGSAYQPEANTAATDLDNFSNENELETTMDSDVYGTDSMAPVLIPKNIDATFNVRARNVLYTDLMLHDFNGRLLTYQGSMNLEDLSAKSDVGDISLSALYMGRDPEQLKFGFSLNVNRFNINRFLNLMPAVDSLMPLLRDLSGIVNAKVAATTNVMPNMDLDLPTLQAVMKLEGDSLVLIDPETFKSLSKWLLFKKKENIIDHMSVEVSISDNQMQMYPFMFDMDRYRLGVQGTNDFNMNFDYHVAVIKSPIPFKFGINIKGNPDKFKIRLGGAKINENTPKTINIVDTTRVNLVNNLQELFRRGAKATRFKDIRVKNANTGTFNTDADTLSHEDSLRFIREGLIEAPDTVVPEQTSKKRSWFNFKKNQSMNSASDSNSFASLPMLALLTETRKRKENRV